MHFNENNPTARYYDIVYKNSIPTEKTNLEVNFFESIFQKNSKLIDLGCGTGRHLLPLTLLGYKVQGIDTSENMLKVLEEKAINSNINILTPKFELSELNETYDGLICFWNAFSEIAKNKDEAVMVLTKIYEILNKNSKIIINVSNSNLLNFNNFKYISNIEEEDKKYETSFEVVDYNNEENITVSKELIKVFQDEKLIDKTQTKVTQKWWKLDELKDIIISIGFRNVQVLGDKFKEFNNTSEKIIIVAEK